MRRWQGEIRWSEIGCWVGGLLSCGVLLSSPIGANAAATNLIADSQFESGVGGFFAQDASSEGGAAENLILDPHFESTVSDFSAQDDTSSVTLSTQAPLEGTKSLRVSIAGWGNNAWWFHSFSGGRARSFKTSAHLRSDVASTSTLQFCAMGDYQDGSNDLTCTPVSGEVGDKGVVTAQLALDSEKPLESVRIRLYQERSESVTFTLDDAVANLDVVQPASGGGGGSGGGGQPGNQPPVAQLTVTPTSGPAPLSVSADTSASSDPDGTIASTRIDFGDGTTESVAVATHIFGAPGTYTVTATVTDNGGLAASKTTNVVVVARGSGFTTHGFTIPTAHPRLWWTPARIAAARTWLTAHPFTPGNGNNVDIAFKHVVSGSDCSAAVNWAANWTPSAAQVTPTAAGSDDMRGAGESVLLVYDWCFDQFTPTQKTNFIAHWNTWVGNVQQQAWGGKYDGTWMSQNNYFWGNLRNELEWGIVSYGDNGSGANSTADNFIGYALDTRWAVAFLPTTQPGGIAAGGVPLEGESYGSAVGAYMLIPTASLANMGRDLWSETAFFKSMMYWMLYWTTPSATFVKDAGGISTFHVATVNEEDKMSNGGILWTRAYFEDWMDYFAQHAAAQYASTAMAGYTRKWLSQLSPVAPLAKDPNATGSPNYFVSNYIISNDPGGAATAYDTLPLDYYASGSGYGVAKTAWNATATQLTYFFKTPMSVIVGHAHEDWGSFSLWRGGRWIMRETAGYSDTIAGTPGIAGGTGQDSGSPLAHNVPVFTNVALGLDSSANRMLPSIHLSAPSVNRMESNTNYFYADVDLTGAYKWDNGHANFNTGVVGHVERELLYLRNLETTVVLDRIMTQNQTHPAATLTAAQVETSFLTHYETNPTIEDANHFTATNGTQVLRQTVLLPRTPTRRVIAEGGPVGQFRVEIAASGAALRYQLHVLQARDSTGSNIEATLVDSNPADPAKGTLTVTLHPATGNGTVIIFNKGQSSSGGTISVAGGNAVNLRTTVQPVSYTDNGPVWQ